MAKLYDREFLDYVEEWIVTNESEIAKAWPQKGGWEGYAQTSIKAFILGKNSTYDILREQHIYTYPGKAADFLLNDSSLQVKDKVIIELKCQSFENYKNFSKGLKEDTTKLIKELKPNYSGATLVVIGIYFTNYPDIPSYFEKKVLGNGEVGICYAIDLNS